MDISDSQVERSLERTEQRRLEAVAARKKQKRNIILGLVLLVLLIVVSGVVLGALSGRRVPPVSTLALTWPHGEKESALDAQLVGDGATLLIKAGQPLRLAVPQSDTWDVTWKNADVQTSGDSFDWTPSGGSATLTAQIRPRLTGWRKTFSFGQPTREIRLVGLAGTAAPGATGNGFLHDIETPSGGLWLHYRVLAKVPLRYDDRAIKVLGEVANQLGDKQSDALTPDSPAWQLIPAFSDDKPAPNDNGTNALLQTMNPVEDARKAFVILNRLAPKATIKVIVEKAKGSSGEARFRLSFDDKGGRFVWVQGAADDKAKPEDWLEEAPVETAETSDTKTEATNEENTTN